MTGYCGNIHITFKLLCMFSNCWKGRKILFLQIWSTQSFSQGCLVFSKVEKTGKNRPGQNGVLSTFSLLMLQIENTEFKANKEIPWFFPLINKIILYQKCISLSLNIYIYLHTHNSNMCYFWENDKVNLSKDIFSAKHYYIM